MSYDLVIKDASSSNQILVIDRFEENFAVCENQYNGEMINVDRNLIPENAIEGMTIKQEENKYIIDYENCIVTRKSIIDKIKNTWEKEENVEYYLVSSILDTAVKCSNIFEKQNIFIKDESVISLLKKGDIIKVVDKKYIIDDAKNLDVENEIKKLLE